VADAMEAAIKASAIQLLDPGLQCIYTAIVESRKIFRRVKAYVVFRVAATIQMITFISVASFVSGCSFDLVFVVILALLSDITMMPLSNDRQKASKAPDNPVVSKILMQAALFGFFQAMMSVIFFYIANASKAGDTDRSGFFSIMKDSAREEPVLWNSYKFSYNGIGDDSDPYPQTGIGTMVNSYQTCMKKLCPAYHCTATKDGGRDKVDSSSCNQANKCTDADVMANNTEVVISGFCGVRATNLTAAQYNSNSDLPNWQECCVQSAGLVHPGVAHSGNEDSVCTEITNVAMFVEMLISSELMIFPVRALGWMWTNRASTSLYISIVGSCILFCCLAAAGVPEDLGPLGDVFSQKLGWKNMLICAAWGVGATFMLDVIKYAWVAMVDGTNEEIQWERVADRVAFEDGESGSN